MTMTYVEYQTLECRGPVDPAPSIPVEGSLLVGTEKVLSFSANQSQFGADFVSIFPAFHKGVRCFLRREEWCPEHGYSASGTQEFVISFEEGVKLFLEKGMFEFSMPTELEFSLGIPATRNPEITELQMGEKSVAVVSHRQGGEWLAFVIGMQGLHANGQTREDALKDLASTLETHADEEYDDSNAKPHVPSARVLAAREGRESHSPRPPRH